MYTSWIESLPAFWQPIAAALPAIPLCAVAWVAIFKPEWFKKLLNRVLGR